MMEKDTRGIAMALVDKLFASIHKGHILLPLYIELCRFALIDDSCPRLAYIPTYADPVLREYCKSRRNEDPFIIGSLVERRLPVQDIRGEIWDVGGLVRLMRKGILCIIVDCRGGYRACEGGLSGEIGCLPRCQIKRL